MNKLTFLAVMLFTSGGVYSQTVQPWMSPEVGDAWASGYKGQGVTVTVVDDFKSQSRFYGDLNGGTTQLLRHGQWTLLEATLVAPSATFKSKDFSTTGTKVSLARGLNVLNLSYGMYAAAGYTSIRWGAQENSIISYATNGQAVISKAAGNDAVSIGGTNKDGNVDYLNNSLKGKQSAIYVGALEANGSVATPAKIASYSNIAGADTAVQQQFLVVGVEGSKTGLYGTSFAAPIVAGYAAVLGSKFKTATPTQITNQLLTTARQDTILNYSSSVHGRGEASISRALAPVAIK